MPLRLALPAALLLSTLLLAACSDDSLPPPLEVYENGRAEVLARADSGRALLIEHEPFDSVMTEPMVMELRMADPRTASEVQRGDKIGFDLVLSANALGQGYRLANIEKLPASTRLRLTAAADSSAADSATTDSAATTGPAAGADSANAGRTGGS